METQGRKRVVLRANSKRLHLEVRAGGPEGAGTRTASKDSLSVTSGLNCTSTTPHSPNVPTEPTKTTPTPRSPPHVGPSHICHSTPLRLHPPSTDPYPRPSTLPPLPSLRANDSSSSLSSSSSTLSLMTSAAHRHTPAVQSTAWQVGMVTPHHSTVTKHRQDHGRGDRSSKGLKKSRWKKGNRVHPTLPPITNTLSSPCNVPQPLTPTVTSPLCANGYSIQHTADLSLPGPSLLTQSSPSCSLPPLFSSQLRKGGRRPSPSVDWSSDGEAQLHSCLPDQQLGVFVGTWNMQQINALPDSLDQFLLPSSQERVSELYVVGTQESTGQRREWEVLVQQTLGPSHLLVHSASLGELYLLMFLRRDLIWFCSEVQAMSYATRPGMMIRTKGGLGISFSLFGTSFLFINSHFTAHHHKVAERNSDMQRIAFNLTSNGLGDYDYVFWLGDLNYRVDMERCVVDQYMEQHHRQPEDWLPLLLHDQLTKEMLLRHVFQGFSEQPIHFPPSYKFDPNSDIYDSSDKQRRPSWTDRILFHSRAGSGVSGCGYSSCQSLQCSDHRPVYALFFMKLEPCSDTDGVPDVMADFDRDVYRIAHQRRKDMAQQSLSLMEGEAGSSLRTNRHVTSSVCTIL